MPTTDPPGGASLGGEHGLQAVVRALGSLLMALGAPTAEHAPPPEAGDPAPPATSASIFESARREAYATIDDAVERARAAAASSDGGALAAVLSRLSQLERRVDAIVERLSRGDGAPAAGSQEAPLAESPAAPWNGDGDGSFEPNMGSVLIMVGPVSGFQGLMRVQSAITTVAAVEAAAIEGYAQSEATVRTLLGGPLRPEQVADALARELGQPARVREASAVDRRVRITLGN